MHLEGKKRCIWGGKRDNLGGKETVYNLFGEERSYIWGGKVHFGVKKLIAFEEKNKKVHLGGKRNIRRGKVHLRRKKGSFGGGKGVSEEKKVHL